MSIGLAEISFFRHAVEEALNAAKSLLNTESGSYDYYEIKTDGRTGPLSLYIDFITDLASSFKADELARNYIAMAEKAFKQGSTESAGYWYETSGELLQRSFSSEIGIYNTEDYSYEIPDETDGYFVVEVD